MENLLKPDFGLMFWSIINFFLLVFILGKVAWKPLIKMIEEREEKINSNIQQAQKLKSDAEKISIQIEKERKQASKELKEKMAQAQEYAQKMKEELIEQGTQESKHIVSNAMEQIEKEKEKAVIDASKQLSQELAMMVKKLALDSKNDNIDNLIKGLDEKR